jgi:nicotinamidase-related amidase
MGSKYILLILVSIASIFHSREQTKSITLRLERIDPKTSHLQHATENVACDKVAIIVMDMWDKHWCKSWTARAAAMIPKMNAALAAARKSGIQVIFSPSAVADFYKDYPQRKAVLAMPATGEFIFPSVDELKNMKTKERSEYTKNKKRYFEGSIYEARNIGGQAYAGYPPLPPFESTGGCECKERDCKMENVWTRQNKDLVIEASDLIVEGNNKPELVNICKARGYTHLLYMGGAGNMCLTSSRETSTINMANRGLKCIYVEDIMISISGNGYNPDTKKTDPSFTPEKGDKMVLEHLKKYIAPSIKSNELFTF